MIYGGVDLVFFLTFLLGSNFLTGLGDGWLKGKVVVLQGLLLGIKFGFVEFKPCEPKLLVFLLDVDAVLDFGGNLRVDMLERGDFEDEGNDNDEMVDIVTHDQFFPQFFHNIDSFSL